MAELTFDEIGRIQRRVADGETTIDAAARAYSLDELADALRMSRGMLQSIADGWTQEQLRARPDESARVSADGEDTWSATEALTHLIATENWYLMHMGRLQSRKEQFDLMPRGLGDHARQEMPKEETASQLRQATERLLAEIAGIAPDADLDAQRDSIFFGPLSLRGWVMLALLHDSQHFHQIQRVTESPAFPVAS